MSPLPRRRHDRHRNALSLGRVHHLRCLQRETVQQRNPRNPLQRQEYPRRTRSHCRGGAEFLSSHTGCQAHFADFVRCGPRLYKAWTIGAHAVRRRSAKSQAGPRARAPWNRQHHVYTRRAGDGRIVAHGTPEQICSVKKSYTGSYLRDLLPGAN